MASRADLPSSRSAINAKSIIMMAFFFTMPIRRMIPTSAITLSSTRESSRRALKAGMNGGRHANFPLGLIDRINSLAQRNTRRQVERKRDGRELSQVADRERG